MKKISRKLLLSSLSLGFAVVALGTTTFAWFTTNATVTADIKVGVQSTTDSITVSKDCFTWGSSVEFDFTKATSAGGDGEKELTAVTYNAGASTLADDDTFSILDGDTLKSYAVDTTSKGVLQFDIYFKVTSADKTVKITGDETTRTNAPVSYTVQKGFSTTTPSALTYAAGAKLKVSALNALRSVVDVSDAIDEVESGIADATTSDLAIDAFNTENTGFARNAKLAGFTDAASVTPTSDATGSSIYNFGQSLGATNAANAYINAVLGTDFTEITANANYAAIAPTANGYINTTLFTTPSAATNATIYKTTFTYWLEGFDADCFDAIFAQTFDIALTFSTAE